jgi:hypothetical protein
LLFRLVGCFTPFLDGSVLREVIQKQVQSSVLGARKRLNGLSFHLQHDPTFFQPPWRHHVNPVLILLSHVSLLFLIPSMTKYIILTLWSFLCSKLICFVRILLSYHKISRAYLARSIVLLAIFFHIC